MDWERLGKNYLKEGPVQKRVDQVLREAGGSYLGPWMKLFQLTNLISCEYK